MERTKGADKVEGKIRWKKTGGGSFRLGNRIIKPGQIFSAFPHEIPMGFRDNIIPLDKLPPSEEVPLNIKKSEYSIQKRGQSLSWFNVVNEQGKVLNETALRRTEALKLIESLQ